VVYKAIHRVTGVQRAIKSIKKSDFFTTDSNEFLKEMDILKNLDHPNVVKLYECFEDQ